MFRNLLVAVSLLAASTAQAGRAPYTNSLLVKSGGSAKLIDGIALNATASTRTLDLTVHKSWGKVLIFVDHTNSAATTVDATFLCSPDGTTYFPRQSASISSGTATLSDLTYSKTVSADDQFYIEADVRGCEAIKSVFSGTSAGGSDLIDVYVVAVTGE